MAAWLSDWLRSVVTVILLAVIVDMLLPNKVMQRYARVAVGLIILLTILNPVMQFFRMDFASTLDAATEIFDEKAAQKNYQMPSLEDIQQKADRLKERQQQEAMQKTKSSLEQAIAEHLEQHIDEKVEKIDITLQQTAKDEMPSGIEKLQVHLLVTANNQGEDRGEQQMDEDHSNSDEIANITEVPDVEEINGVHVAIEASNEHEDAISAMGASEQHNVLLSNPQLEQFVKNVISSRWEVSKKLISVQLMAQT
ncbi:stage III sporulation protein AF [Paenibacillus yanchengensis]|uniref:Stage III sporulation protein AF n=1 Tax=Paenibacillus yanchengensis TaxID=2035833 RepID=A0ABW4YJZ8_9BACL